jgi:large subunit ribosomal protein L35
MKKLKLKTHKGAAKRFKITASGKVIRKKLRNRGSSHRRTKDHGARKDLQDRNVIEKTEAKKIKKLLHV